MGIAGRGRQRGRLSRYLRRHRQPYDDGQRPGRARLGCGRDRGGSGDARPAGVEAYAKAQGMWRDAAAPDPVFTDTLALDMSTVQPSLAGPKRPQDKVLLSNVDDNFNNELVTGYKKTGDSDRRVAVEGCDFEVGH